MAFGDLIKSYHLPITSPVELGLGLSVNNTKLAISGFTNVSKTVGFYDGLIMQII